MPTTVISVMTRDRVGIVADVAERIAGLGGDIADLSQTTLRGFFTLILVATFPAGLSVEAVAIDLDEIGSGEQADDWIEIVIKVVPDEPEQEPEEPLAEDYVLAVRGPDRVGLLADVTRICSDHVLNILDLSTRASSGQYVTLLHVDARGVGPLEVVRKALDAAASSRGFTYTLQHNDVFRATHDIGA